MDRGRYVPVAFASLYRSSVHARVAPPLGRARSTGVHRHSGSPGGRRSHPRRRHGSARWLRVWSMARVRLLDDWSHHRFPGGLLARSTPRRAVREEGDRPGGVAAARLRGGGRGSDPVLHHLSRARTSQRHALLPVRCEPPALLGVRSRVDTRPDAGYLGTIRGGSEGGNRRVYAASPAGRRRHGARPAALLLPIANCLVAPPACLSVATT